MCEKTQTNVLSNTMYTIKSTILSVLYNDFLLNLLSWIELTSSKVNLILEHSPSPRVKKALQEIFRIHSWTDYPLFLPRKPLKFIFYLFFLPSVELMMCLWSSFGLPGSSCQKVKQNVWIWSFLECWVWVILLLCSDSQLFSRVSVVSESIT